MRSPRILTALLTLVPLIGFGVRADAHEAGGRFRTFPYQATGAGGGTADGPTVCDSAGHCVTVQTATDPVFGGDLFGTGVGGSAVTISEQGILVVTGTNTVVGGLRQCGEGTFVYTTAGTLDLATGTVFTFTLDVVPGTGTGALVGLTGHAVGKVDFADPNGVSNVTGWVRCRSAR